jgi:mycofactocin biosynthetic radical S-adenosylmethionine protein MftC
MSTAVVSDPVAPDADVALSLERAYALHPNVAVRPEPFGALAYHYGNRKLVFLKSPRMVTLVESLGQHRSLREALEASGVPAAQFDRYVDALTSLAASEMIVGPAADAAGSAGAVGSSDTADSAGAVGSSDAAGSSDAVDSANADQATQSVEGHR